MSPITLFVSSPRFARIALLASLALAIVPTGAHAQESAQYKACTQGSLVDCALIQFTSTPGTSGLNSYEIWIKNLDWHMSPTVMTDLVFFSFATGLPAPLSPDIGFDAITPTGSGDLSNWFLFEDDGSGQQSLGLTTLGAGIGDHQFLDFTFSSASLIRPSDITILDLEFNDTYADGTPNVNGCGGNNPACNVTATPEPASVLLALTGFAGLAGLNLRRRRTLA